MKAMILSAGYGTRLGQLVDATPKPMLRVGERPIIEWIILNLACHGFNDIAVNLHCHADVIREHLGDGSRFGVKLVYSFEPQLLGTAGGVRRMGDLLSPEEPFLIHYGDIICNQDFSAMLEFHRRSKALTTLLVHQRAESNSVVAIDAQYRITDFLERPTKTERHTLSSPWANSGVAIAEPNILAHIPSGQPSDLPRDVYRPLVPSGRLFAFPLTGYRCAIDSPERLCEASLAAAQGVLR